MSQNTYRKRRFFTALIIALSLVVYGLMNDYIQNQNIAQKNDQLNTVVDGSTSTMQALESLEVKGRAPKTGYARAQFGEGWRKTGTCTTRELILARDLDSPEIRDCKVYSGTLNDLYTGKKIAFMRGSESSDDVQIDHIVALSDAWQKGAQALDFATREHLANDPLELLAVDGDTNQKKGDGDAATWLPPYKEFRCRYVARQIAVKQKYKLWVTQSEKTAMSGVLMTCPSQPLPVSR